MDAADTTILEGSDNKENIPPVISVKEISSAPTDATAVVQDCKLPGTATGRKFKRKFRMPLKDITKLLPVQSSSTTALPDLGLHLVPSSSTSESLNCRKRKALNSAAAENEDIDLKHKASSKILRKGFR